jgi:hypothetical protein
MTLRIVRIYVLIDIHSIYTNMHYLILYMHLDEECGVLVPRREQLEDGQHTQELVLTDVEAARTVKVLQGRAQARALRRDEVAAHICKKKKEDGERVRAITKRQTEKKGGTVRRLAPWTNEKPYRAERHIHSTHNSLSCYISTFPCPLQCLPDAL